jgi:hypothetical protein
MAVTVGSTQFGNHNANAKVYNLKSPDGKDYVVEGAIRKFCDEHNLAYETLVRNSGKGTIKKGRCAGWTVTIETKDSV